MANPSSLQNACHTWTYKANPPQVHRSSVVIASDRSTEDHRFNSCRGLRVFFLPVLGHMLITSFFISSPNWKFTIICLHNIFFSGLRPHFSRLNSPFACLDFACSNYNFSKKNKRLVAVYTTFVPSLLATRAREHFKLCAHLLSG